MCCAVGGRAALNVKAEGAGEGRAQSARSVRVGEEGWGRSGTGRLELSRWRGELNMPGNGGSINGVCLGGGEEAHLGRQRLEAGRPAEAGVLVRT